MGEEAMGVERLSSIVKGRTIIDIMVTRHKLEIVIMVLILVQDDRPCFVLVQRTDHFVA
jgi:hypothetical protein